MYRTSVQWSSHGHCHWVWRDVHRFCHEYVCDTQTNQSNTNTPKTLKHRLLTTTLSQPLSQHWFLIRVRNPFPSFYEKKKRDERKNKEVPLPPFTLKVVWNSYEDIHLLQTRHSISPRTSSEWWGGPKPWFPTAVRAVGLGAERWPFCSCSRLGNSCFLASVAVSGDQELDWMWHATYVCVWVFLSSYRTFYISASLCGYCLWVCVCVCVCTDAWV